MQKSKWASSFQQSKTILSESPTNSYFFHNGNAHLSSSFLYLNLILASIQRFCRNVHTYILVYCIHVCTPTRPRDFIPSDKIYHCKNVLENHFVEHDVCITLFSSFYFSPLCLIYRRPQGMFFLWPWLAYDFLVSIMYIHLLVCMTALLFSLLWEQGDERKSERWW